MRTTWTMAGFLMKGLARSAAGLAPLAVMLGLYAITLEHGGDSNYFVVVGGIDMSLVCLVLSLSLCGQANRGALYPLVHRLERRAKLVDAVTLATILMGAAYALVFAIMATAQGKVSLSLAEIALSTPRWLALFLYSAMLGVLMSRMVAGRYAQLLIYVVVLVAILAAQNPAWLWGEDNRWASSLAGLLALPPLLHLGTEAVVTSPLRYLVVVTAPVLYAAVQYLVAVRLFRDKDLLWDG